MIALGLFDVREAHGAGPDFHQHLIRFQERHWDVAHFLLQSGRETTAAGIKPFFGLCFHAQAETCAWELAMPKHRGANPKYKYVHPSAMQHNA